MFLKESCRVRHFMQKKFSKNFEGAPNIGTTHLQPITLKFTMWRVVPYGKKQIPKNCGMEIKVAKNTPWCFVQKTVGERILLQMILQ